MTALCPPAVKPRAGKTAMEGRNKIYEERQLSNNCRVCLHAAGFPVRLNQSLNVEYSFTHQQSLATPE